MWRTYYHVEIVKLCVSGYVVCVDADGEIMRRLDHVSAYADHLAYGVDHKPDDLLVELDDDDARVFVGLLRVEAEPLAQVDHGDDAPAQIDDALDERRRIRHAGNLDRKSGVQGKSGGVVR